VLARAASEPSTLVLGLDASPAGFVEASRRAARPARKGGLPNAAFVVAAAEDPPAELVGCSDALTIAFPWGSLLRGALALDDEAAAGIAMLLAPEATYVTGAVWSVDGGRTALSPATAANRAARRGP